MSGFKLKDRGEKDPLAAPSEQSLEEYKANSLFDESGLQQDLGPNYSKDWIQFRSDEQVSPYAQEMRARYAMDPRKRSCIILAIAWVMVFILAVILPNNIFQQFDFGHGFAWWYSLLSQNVKALFNFVTGIQDNNGIELVVYQYLIIAFAGAGLAMTGAVYQGTLKNALVSPSTLGVMSGGSLGSIIYVLVFGVLDETIIMRWSDYYETYYGSLNWWDYFLVVEGQALCSIIGCFVVVALVLLVAVVAGRGKVSKTGLVIAGQVFALIITSVISIIRYYLTYAGTDEQLMALATISSGSVSQTSYRLLDVFLVGIPVIVCIGIIMHLRQKLNLLAFNDEEARSMGINVTRMRIAVIALCTIMTGVIVSFCGNIGFVGFLVPHLARKVVGPDAKYLIPATVAIGSMYVIISNHILGLGQLLNGSLGTLTSILGIVMFIIVAIRQRARGNADWTS